MGQGFKNKLSTEQAKLEKFSKKSWWNMWTDLTSCSYFSWQFHWREATVKLKKSNKNTLIANKTSHSGKNCNDLPN